MPNFAQGQLLAGYIKIFGGGAFSFNGGLQCFGVCRQRMQHIGNILKGGNTLEDCASVGAVRDLRSVKPFNQRSDVA